MFVNQYSFLIMAVMAIAGAAWWAATGDWAVTRIVVLVLVTLGAVVLGMLVRREATTTPLPAVLAGGQPVLVEYYSDY